MRSLIPVLLVLSLAGPAGAAQMQMARTQPGVDLSRHEPQMASLSPSLRSWVTLQARATLDSGADPEPQLIASDARARLEGQDFSNADVESLLQLVLMEAARQADADLRDTMEQMRAANERKARMRETIAAQRDASKAASEAARTEYAEREAKVACINPPCRFPAIAIQPRLDQAKIVAVAGPVGSPEADADSESMSEMSEIEQLRLQMATDRRSKALQALSNLLQKNSETASSISSNLK